MSQSKKAHHHCHRRGAALALATVVTAGSAVLLAAPAAHAETVDVDYQCKTPIGEKGAVSPIDISAEKLGQGDKGGNGYKLTMSFEKGVSSSPVELGKGAMKPSALIKLGGAESGTVPVSGPANSEAIPANTPIKINDLSGTYTPKKSGKVTFTASTLTIKALGTTTTCTPQNSPKPSLTLDIKPGEVDESAATGPGGGPGELPKTGPADSALALATLGGTVLLAGVAGTLWLTRRGQQPAR
ncbi:LPXTG cell wall anchor domain-containing protein [Streptomyces gobiensis]|uniref:LPXTG cell wall anchor domain-containing protein n=1 Tax=Streptomyces gobiensis TaxID=2875706 RepID=UPI001E3D68BC|nr:LPXTG cell wall anchor domain-containing protein [Streptomyces gobiensis]UGY91790.1 LPXTG cell wall anchor domain-containing protein [Streptomyces gobiensis]